MRTKVIKLLSILCGGITGVVFATSAFAGGSGDERKSILVGLVEPVEQATIKSIAADYHLEAGRTFPEIRVVQFFAKPEVDLPALLKEVAGDPRVEYAELDEAVRISPPDQKE